MTSGSLDEPVRSSAAQRSWRSACTVAVVGAVLGLAACSPPEGAAERVDVPDLAADVARLTPDEPVAAPDELDPVPPAGTVALVPGPFDDRLAVNDPALVEGRVTATVDVVSDVSELLALELDVAWYDEEGALLGSTREVVDPDDAEAFHTQAGIVGLPIDVAAPGAASATLSIPVLVNE